MKNFFKIAEGIDVLPSMLAIHLNPSLWNDHADRIERENSPHVDASDIWVRYNDFRKKKFSDFNESHFAVWYPAYRSLPQLKPIIFGLMARTETTHLGGVLITKIPPGKKIFPHTDTGWHPEFYNCKVHVPLMTNEMCWSRSGTEVVIMKTGEAWRMDNTVDHEVVNDGNEDRVTLIVCLHHD